jgi:hypothetical protein
MVDLEPFRSQIVQMKKRQFQPIRAKPQTTKCSAVVEFIVAPYTDTEAYYLKPLLMQERKKPHAFGRQASQQKRTRWKYFFSFSIQQKCRT